MADYARGNSGGATHFTTKDALTTGDPDKVIVGSQFDTEFNDILTAVATKYDSTDLADQAAAEAETATTSLLSPKSLAHWSDDNGGMVGELQALADPGADGLLGWDDGEAADSNVAFFTLGAGLEFSGATLNLKDAVAGTGMTVTSSVLNVIGGNGITANANDIALTDSAVTSSNPVGFTSGAPVFDASSLTSMQADDLAADDIFIVEDGGAPKRIQVQNMGLRVSTQVGAQGNLSAGEMNSIMEFTGTSGITLPPDGTVPLPIGVPIVLNVKHATEYLTVTPGTAVTLVSRYHPAGAVAGAGVDLVKPGGTAILYKTAADVWCLSGDIQDS